MHDQPREEYRSETVNERYSFSVSTFLAKYSILQHEISPFNFTIHFLHKIGVNIFNFFP